MLFGKREHILVRFEKHYINGLYISSCDSDCILVMEEGINMVTTVVLIYDNTTLFRVSTFVFCVHDPVDMGAGGGWGGGGGVKSSDSELTLPKTVVHVLRSS